MHAPGTRILPAAFLASALVATTALAHHGWTWAVDEQTELSGTIQEVFIGNPHAVITLEAEDGVWTVELAPPSATRRAGFDENAAKIGDEATVLGHRSRDANEKRFKAVRITVNGKSYDVYPNRVES